MTDAEKTIRPPRRTQAERTESTRAALIEAARRLFAERGYASVATEEIVREAGVTRGALYHHFDGKKDLLRASYEQIEGEISARFADGITPGAEPLQVLREGAEMFLDACLEPEVQQIALLDAPAVLGWEEWRAIGEKYAAGLIEGVLRHGIEIGAIREQPVEPLRHALLGALDEIAMYVARADDPAAARKQSAQTLASLLGALRP
jgi:AcrR family transcriptional regulator